MPIRVGTRFGAYEVSSSLGSGGMGEVYRARDTNLKRDVALKTLPPAVANDADRLARFQREAEVLASLNHPNIAQIYGLERSEGTTALAMELIEGPTLEDRISQGPIPIEEALHIANQIADALEAAHERGIVHRDLKPANIKLRSDGAVKVLDFGIAKALDPRGMTGPGPAALTTPAMTEAGFILGTAAYMSPEQARGKAVDRRTDIWAFGCVLYEMLSGHPAFLGEDVASTLARVLQASADFGALPSDTSASARRTIELCFEKDERKRIADMRDVKLGLAGAFGTTVLAPVAQPLWRRTLPFALIAVAASVVTIALDRGLMREAAPAAAAPVSRFAQPLPMSGPLLGSGDRSALSVSPDGSSIAFTRNADAIYLRRLGDLEPKPIHGTEGGSMPFFSPDGRWIGFTRDNHLFKVPTAGGIAVDLGQEGSPQGATWLEDGTIVYINGLLGDLKRIADNGRKVDLLAKPAEGRIVFDPRGVPGTDWVLYSVGDPSDLDNAEIVALSLKTGQPKVILTGGSDARYVQSGHLLYVRGDALYAAPFDLRTMTVTGAGLPVVDGLSRALIVSRSGNYDVSNGGTLVYLEAGSAEQAEPVWIDRQGHEERIGVAAGSYLFPRISPDGRRVVLTALNQGSLHALVVDVGRKVSVPLTNTAAVEGWAVWWPDGKRVVYFIPLAGVFAKAADGTGTRETISLIPNIWPEAISSDGKDLVVTTVSGDLSDPVDGHGGIGILELEPSTPEIRWIVEPPRGQFRRNAALSPNNHWIAYESNETGAVEIFVRAFPNVADAQRVSVAGGEQPAWSRDGRELFYVEPGSPPRLMAVAVEDGDQLKLGETRPLMDWPYPSAPGRNYDLDPNGPRFLAIKPLPAALSNVKPAQLHVVQNWFEELKRLVPPK
jgi:serine/threonine-protein kinase